MHGWMDVCMDVCMYVCMHVCMYVWMDVCMHACMYVCMYECLCMYVCMYACMYVCMYVCTHAYTDTVFNSSHIRIIHMYSELCINIQMEKKNTGGITFSHFSGQMAIVAGIYCSCLQV